MPVDEVDAVVDPLVDAYEKVDARISDRLRSWAGDPSRERAARRGREVQNAIDRDLTYLRREVVPRASDAAYWSAEVGGATGQVLAGAQTVRFDVIDRGAVEVVAKGLQRDLLEATDTMSLSARRLIRKAGKDEALFKLIGGQTAVQAGRTMAGTLTQHGLYAVTYANGARHGLAEYSAMAMRTSTANAYNESLLTGAVAEGVGWFEIFDGPDCGLSFHGDPQLADGLVVDKDTAAKYLIAHPNCRRSFGPRPDVTSKTAAADASRSTTKAQRFDQIAADRARGAQIASRADKGAVSQFPTRAKYKAENAAKKAASAQAKAGADTATAAATAAAKKAAAVRAKAAAQEAVNQGKVGSYRAFREDDTAGMRGWGTREFQPWQSDISGQERRAVTSYTGTTYHAINDDLRRGVPVSKQAYASEAGHLKRALDAPGARLPEDVVLHRGVKARWTEFVERFDRGGFRRGDIFEDKGFMSTSLNPDVANTFGGGVTFEIRAAKGTKGAYLGDLSRFGHAEYEVLLQRGTKLRVVDAVRSPNGQRKLVFEVAEQP